MVFSEVYKEHGFTLMELLVVIAIVGILAGIGFANFLSYKKHGYDGTASSDLKNAATAEEAYFVDHAEYISCSGVNDCISKLPGLSSFSEYVEIEITGGTESFTGTASNSRGTGKVFTWNSQTGLSSSP